MRIISGKWRGRNIHSVKGTNTRPTSDRVKEAIFNIISSRVEGSNVLDIFAGTGNMGFEVLSRGGSRAVFIERDIKATKIIAQNAQLLDCEDMVHIVKRDVFRAIDEIGKTGGSFHIVFIDPPYSMGIEEKTIRAIIDADILDRAGIILVEHDSKNSMPESIDILRKVDIRKYGNTSVSFYMRGDNS